MTRAGTESQNSILEGESLNPKQAHLVRSAYKVMGEKGLFQFTLQDVANESGVSKAILPYYFESKENLILLTMRWALACVVRSIREAVANADTAEAKASSMIDAIFADPESSRRFHLVVLDFLGYAIRADKLDDVSIPFERIWSCICAEIISSDSEEGVYRVGDASEAPWIVLALINGILTVWIQDKDWTQSHSEYRDMCKRSVLGYLGSIDTKSK